MSSVSKKLAAIGASLALGATLLVSSAAPALAAGYDQGTFGAGYTTKPSVAPFTSFAYVTQCHSRLGTPGAALSYRGRAVVSNNVAYGPVNVAGFDGDSKVTARKVGSYNGDWYCHKIQ